MAAQAPFGAAGAGRVVTASSASGGPGGDREQMAAFVELARTRDPDLRSQLIERNLGLAHYLARRFAQRGESYDDLVQISAVALVQAVDRFDPTMGVAFSTFATRTIVGQLKRHFRDRVWAVRAPRRVQDRTLRLSEALALLTQRLGRSPTIAELAEDLGCSAEEVVEAIEAGQGYRAMSLDVPASGDASGTLVDLIGDDHDPFGDVEDRASVLPLLRRLPERERRIVTMRFVHGMTQSEIAARVGISQMHVSRLLTRSLRRLRAQLGDIGPPTADRRVTPDPDRVGRQPTDRVGRQPTDRRTAPDPDRPPEAPAGSR
jgi:RNA polymerase sigma-B factor